MISIVIISKDEASLDDTLVALVSQTEGLDEKTEIIVVDASEGRLEEIQLKHAPDVRWIQFRQPLGLTITIPHQRNVGVGEALGEIIVFIDAGCYPEPGWLEYLLGPLRQGEDVAVGPVLGTQGSTGIYDGAAQRFRETVYLRECGSGNMAFRRAAFDAVGRFDEGFSYGSDVDFSWRLVDAGYRLRSVPDAIILHDWGTGRRQLRRSYMYGSARMRLYRKHRSRRRRVLRDDPMLVVYPAFLLGLPLTLVFPFYPALLIIPAWRNRSDRPLRVLLDHLAYGYGAIAELVFR
jgi:glycosyltransferase involved in cell wall biosynthesis